MRHTTNQVKTSETQVIGPDETRKKNARKKMTDHAIAKNAKIPKISRNLNSMTVGVTER